MGPKTVAAALRQIAARIDASKNPQRALVARDLRGLIKRIAEASMIEGENPEGPRSVHSQEQQDEECSGPGGVTGQEQQAMPSSGVGKQMLSEALKSAQEALAKGDHDGLKKAIENVNKAHR